MSVWRTFACAAVLLLSATESLAGEGWRIVQTTGAVKAGGAGFMPAAVQPNQTLPSDAWVETGSQGRVVLVRGLETIALNPNSRVQLPSQEVNGNTQVLQTLGSALYRVGKQKAPHFQVDTPYLAAVVKGTTFTVTVTDAISSVDVTEGLVEVQTPDASDSEFVRPGFSGVVSKHDTGNVVVVNSPEAPAPGVPMDTKSEASDGAVKNETTVIAAAIGEVDLDVKEVSGGLATSVDAPAIIGSKGDGIVVDTVKGETDVVKDGKDGGESSGPAPSVEPTTEPTLSVEPGPTVTAETSTGGGPSGVGGSGGGSGDIVDVDDNSGRSGGGYSSGYGSGRGGPSSVDVDFDADADRSGGHGSGNGGGGGGGGGSGGGSGSGGGGSGND